MNKKIILILSGAIIVLLISSIILGIKCFQYKRIINDFYGVNENVDYSGIYQTQYYNEFNKSKTITIILKKDGSCSYKDIVTGLDNGVNNTNNCKYEINDKHITMTTTLYSSENVISGEKIREGDFINESTLFIENKQVYKIS